MKERLEKIMKAAVDENFVSGVNVLVLKDGKEVVYGEYGLRNVEEHKPMTRDTMFRLYSMTKPITATAVMILMDRGLIDLADPISKYIPAFRDAHVNIHGERDDAKREIMILDLLNMTSGMPYPNAGSVAGRQATEVFEEIDRRLYTEEAMSTMEIINALGKNDLEFHPGEHFMYGTSADVLGALVEVVSGMRYSDFLKKEIFGPLGMRDTDFYVPWEKQDRLAKVYNTVDGNLVEVKTNNLGIRYPMDKAPAFESGGAGLASNLDDYAKFATMLLQGGIYNGTRILSSAVASYLTSGKLMPNQQVDLDRDWNGLYGYTYGNLMRVMEQPRQNPMLTTIGEYGWDGWLGVYMANDPVNNVTMLMGIQKIDAGTCSLTRKLKNAIWSELIG